jgi:hypothetical protein
VIGDGPQGTADYEWWHDDGPATHLNYRTFFGPFMPGRETIIGHIADRIAETMTALSRPDGEITWAVICRGDRFPDGTPGDWELATQQVFPSQVAAREYAAGVSPSRRPVVVFGDWRDTRARAHLLSSRVAIAVVAVSLIEPPTDVLMGAGRLLPLCTTRVFHTVRGRFSQLRLPGDGELPGEPLPPLDADPSIWTI